MSTSLDAVVGASLVGLVMARTLMGGGSTIELGLVSRLMAWPKGGSCVPLAGLVAWMGVMLKPAVLFERPAPEAGAGNCAGAGSSCPTCE